MRKTFALLSVQLCLISIPSLNMQAATTTTATSKSSDDERAIRAQAREYARAFAIGDSRAIGKLWAEDAVFTLPDGTQAKGRVEIEKLFARNFAATGGQPLQVTIESIRFPTGDLAIEEGVTRLLKPSAAGTGGRYTAIHTKRNGQWKMVEVTETRLNSAPSPAAIADLSWMIGDWSVEGGKEKMRVHNSWASNKKFIECDFRPASAGANDEPTFVELIGWDPVSRQISSWYFDGSGSVGRGTWVKTGNNWIVRTAGIEPNGMRGYATHMLRKDSNDSFRWRSVRRSLNGKRLADMPALKVVRVN
jgi:uncharacterized protein (TIGR02246 family)